MTFSELVPKRLRTVAKELFHRTILDLLQPLPREARFGAALELARSIAPLVELFPRLNGVEDRTALALRLILIAATDLGLELDLPTAVSDPALLPRLAADNRGIIACGGHLGLAPAFIREAHDSGHRLLTLSRRRDWKVCGTAAAFRSLLPGPQVLIEARQHLRSGGMFILMADGPEQDDGVPIPGHALFVRLPIFRFAVRSRTPLIFFSTRLREDGVIAVDLKFVESDQREAEALASECASFLGAAFNEAAATRMA
jgi:hypothetical protein